MRSLCGFLYFHLSNEDATAESEIQSLLNAMNVPIAAVPTANLSARLGAPPWIPKHASLKASGLAEQVCGVVSNAAGRTFAAPASPLALGIVDYAAAGSLTPQTDVLLAYNQSALFSLPAGIALLSNLLLREKLAEADCNASAAAATTCGRFINASVDPLRFNTQQRQTFLVSSLGMSNFLFSPLVYLACVLLVALLVCSTRELYYLRKARAHEQRTSTRHLCSSCAHLN